MKVKSIEWKEFKKSFIENADIFFSNQENITFPLIDEEDFCIVIDGVKTMPIFNRKDDFFKVEYNFETSNTIIKKISFAKFKDSYRIEFIIKTL